MDGEKKFVTVDEAATELGVSGRSVRRLIDRGEMPALKVGGTYRIRADHLRRFIAEAATAAYLEYEATDSETEGVLTYGERKS